MNLRQLQTLLVIAECRSISRAAERLHVSQPAVTKSLRELERSLGVALFERSARGLSPTRYGDSLIRHAKSVSAELRHAGEELAALRGAASGRVSIGTAPIGAAKIVPQAVAALLHDQPGLVVNVVEGTHNTLLPAVAVGELDLFFGPLGDDGPGEGLVEEVLFYDRLHIVARRNHPLAKRRTLELADLLDQPWVLPPTTVRPRRQLENAFRRQGLEPPTTGVETASPLILRTLLLESDRISVIARQALVVEVELGLIKLLPVDLGATIRPIGIVMRAGATPSPAVAMLIDHLKAEVGGTGRDTVKEARRLS
ncbi:MAG TPA: LysR substrate-binding domain-containing protein [Alphaproteobacteria bacterium]|nr:LysR substrate-binding domain-containing protein [Alphaproteobacteria bacterium]